MGTAFKSDTANYAANARGYIWNVPSAPAGVFWTAGSAALGARNFASITAASADTVGTPVANTAFLGFDGLVNYLQTQVDEADSMTIIVTARNTDTLAATATQPTLAGNFDNVGTPQGVGFYVVSNGLRLAYTVDSGGGVGVQRVIAMVQADAVNNVWNTYAAVIRSGVEGAIYNLRLGTSMVTAETRARIKASARKLRIGSGSGGGPAGNSDIAFCGILPVGLTLAQCDVAGLQVRTWLSEQRGITA